MRAQMSKRLIINCDDFGQSSAMNQAIIQLLEEKKVSSATIITTAPGFEEAASWCAKQRPVNVGLHLTMTSEFDALRWRSITERASLHDSSGYQYQTVKKFEQRAKTRDVLKEIDAQYARLKRVGLVISHVDNHMGSLYGVETGRSFLAHTLWRCSRWGLPFRFFRYIWPSDPLLGSMPNIERPVARVTALADLLGVAIPDYLLSHPFHVQDGETYGSFKRSIIDKMYALPEGISEIYFHPGVDDAGMQASIPHWRKRVWEHRLLLDEDFSYAMRDGKVLLTSYQSLNRKQRRPRWHAAWKLLRELMRQVP